jgi:PAS domain S-box-containing protein
MGYKGVYLIYESVAVYCPVVFSDFVEVPNEMKAKMKQSTISLIMWTIFLFISVLMWFSIHFVSHSIKMEQQLTSKAAETRQLGVDLMMTSFYLVQNARKFVVTGDIKYFNNYWNEVNVNKTRDKVVARLREMKIPSAELALLEKATRSSDELVAGETRAMRLVLEAQGVPVSQMYPDVAAFHLSPEDQKLNQGEKINRARDILFGTKYDNETSSIKSLIDEFEGLMNARASAELQDGKETTAKAILLQYILAMITILAIAVILRILHMRLVHPVRAYTETLNRLGGDENLNLELAGTRELYLLAQAFNQRTAQLRESEQRFRTLFESAPLSISISRGTSVLYANPAHMAMVKRSGRDDNQDISLLKYFAPQSRSQIAENIRRRAQGLDVPISYDAMCVNRDGSQFPVILSTASVNFADGPATLAFVTDISDRKRAQEEIAAWQRRYELAAQVSRQLIFDCELSRGEILWSGSVEQILGYSPDEMNGSINQWLGMIAPEDRRRVGEIMQEAERLCAPCDVEYRIRHKDGHYVDVHNLSFFVSDEQGNATHMIGSLQDISERKKTEEALRLAKEEAERANAAKSEFLANMSHEIRTPLNAIIGFSELLSSLVVEAKKRDYVEAINTAGKSLLTLINDVLDLSKIEAGMMEIEYTPVNPGMLLQEIKQIFKQNIDSKNLQILIDIEPDLPRVLLLDETRLRQVLLNLVGNAVKFTERGYIRLAAQKLFHDEANYSNLDLIISVEDSGIGISPEEHTTIFESFKQQAGQSNRKYGGTGLGLTISKKLVEMMKGEIFLESTPGSGSTFTVVLHNVDVAPDQALEEEADDSQVLFEEALVLVMDDVESNRFLLKEILESRGLRVVTAENGYDILSLVEEVKPDLILMDVWGPTEDEKKAAFRLKENPATQNIPIIALTASSLDQWQDAENQYPFDGFLSKPVTASSLLGELSKYVKTRLPSLAGGIGDQEEMAFASVRGNKEAKTELTGEIEVLMDQLNGPLRMGQIKQTAEAMSAISRRYGIEFLEKESLQLHAAASANDIKSILNISRKLNNASKSLKD